jgi:hypothetical protein
MIDGESTHVAADRAHAAAATLRDSALPLLRAATDALGWSQPLRDQHRDGALTSFSARALHKYGDGLAMLTVRVATEGGATLDLRVTCEFADADIFNAERIVRVASAAEPEVGEWLYRQLEGCLAVLRARVRPR